MASENHHRELSIAEDKTQQRGILGALLHGAVRVRYAVFIVCVSAFFFLLQQTTSDLQSSVGNLVHKETRLEEIVALQAELSSFLLASHAFVRGAPDASKEDVQFKFDLAWARIHTLSSDSHVDVVRRVNVDGSPIPDLRNMLVELDPIVAKLRPGDFQGFEKINARIAPTIKLVTSWNMYARAFRRKLNFERHEEQNTHVNTLDRLQLYTFWASILIICILIAEGVNSRKVNRLLQERKKEVLAIALQDELTGTKNRRYLDDNLGDYIAGNDKDPVQLMVIDLDGFKGVNDRYGHACGDRTLENAARRISDACPADSILARVGGDEFVVVLRGNKDRALETGNKVIASLTEPFFIEDLTIHISASIGLTSAAPLPVPDWTALMRDADLALYESKGKGGGQCHFYEPALYERAEHRRKLETDLPAAIQNGDIRVVLQPQLRLRDHAVCGVEVLSRWTHPTLGEVSPDTFIPIAETLGLGNALDSYIARTSLQLAKQLRDNGFDFQLAVNVLPCRTSSQPFIEAVHDAVFETNFPPERLTLEFTENVIMDDTVQMTESFHQLRDLGVKLAVDDFGKGYSNLRYFATSSFDYLKIDREFVAGLDADENKLIIVDNILNLANGLSMSVVAEGIETDKEWQVLKKLGVATGQGYYIARPMPYDELLVWLSEHTAQRPALVHAERLSA